MEVKCPAQDVAEYAAEVCAELAELAREAGHDSLAYILELAAAEANIASLGPMAHMLVGG